MKGKFIYNSYCFVTCACGVVRLCPRFSWATGVPTALCAGFATYS